MRKLALALLFVSPLTFANKTFPNGPEQIQVDQDIYLKAFVGCMQSLQGTRVQKPDEDFVYACRNSAKDVATIGPDITGISNNVVREKQ